MAKQRASKATGQLQAAMQDLQTTQASADRASYLAQTAAQNAAKIANQIAATSAANAFGGGSSHGH